MGIKKTPLYKTIELELVEKIKNGVYQVGSMIPTEHELAQFYKVSRVTVRQATNNLVAQNVLTRTQGIGTFVANITLPVEHTVRILGFNEEMTLLNKEPSTDVLIFEIKPADGCIAQKLQIEKEAPVYHIVRLRKTKNIPLVVEFNYISVAQFPDLSYEIMKKSKYDYIEKVKHLEIGYSNHLVLPILPDDYIASILNINKTKPILKILNTTYLKNNTILDYTELFYNSDLFKYVATRTR